jgi:hypothetical protein
MNPKLELDYNTTDYMHDAMIDWVSQEAELLKRDLSWDEARALLRAKLTSSGSPLRTDGMEVLSEWLGSTNVDVDSWKISEPKGVAWGNYETQEDAHAAVDHYMQLRKMRELDYVITAPDYRAPGAASQ